MKKAVLRKPAPPTLKPPNSDVADQANTRRSGVSIEDSVQLRVVSLICVLIGVAAVLAQGVVNPSAGLAAIVLIPFGYWYSHTHRTKRNIPLKLVLAVGMILSLGGFLRSMRTADSVDEARAYLAELFLWVQILHSFDLPRRKDLAYSMASSLVLMAAAGSLTITATYGLFVIAYLPFAAAWLFLSNRRAMAHRATSDRVIADSAPKRPRGLWRSMATVGMIAVVLAVAVFAFTPRVQGIQLVAPPFSFGGASAAPISDFQGQIVDPSAAPPTAPGETPAFSPDAYPGFSDQVDLRVRGRLSDNLVMRVRAARPAFWRAGAYDTWDGTTWTLSTQGVNIDVGGSNPAGIPPPVELERHDGQVEQLLQTYYIESGQPNIVFAADQARAVYYPSSGLKVDDTGSIRAPSIMQPGMIYSVISEIPIIGPRELRALPPVTDPDLLARYTQLPPSTTNRVKALSDQITLGAPTTFDKVMAIQDWLKEHTEYLLDIPPDPPGVDAVDHFLFETRKGYCEHFSAAMIVLLRAQGIPARFAVGFDPGDRNIFTGFYEVKESDAHSWVEVLYPGAGWIPYDPTHVVPLAEETRAVNFSGVDLLPKIGAFFSAAIPTGVKDAVGTTLRGLGHTAQWAIANWYAVVPLALLAALAAWALTRKRRERRSRPDSRVAAAFMSMCELFSARGLPRDPSRTPSEYLADLIRGDPIAASRRDDLRIIVRGFERERFAADATPDEEALRLVEDAEAALRRDLQLKAGSSPGR